MLLIFPELLKNLCAFLSIQNFIYYGEADQKFCLEQAELEND